MGGKVGVLQTVGIGIVGRWRKCGWPGWVGGSFEKWSGLGRTGVGGLEAEGRWEKSRLNGGKGGRRGVHGRDC